MGILDELIKVKSSTQQDDLIKILDEVPAYEKLSTDKSLADLKTSEVTRKMCPMLAAFTDGNLYETILAELAAYVYLQIEGQVPEILNTAVERTKKQKKQLEILESGIVRVTYASFTEYVHESMKDHIAAVFTRQDGNVTTVAIIVRNVNSYIMYHGSYEIKDTETSNKNVPVSEPIVIRTDTGLFAMNTYSVLGNNGYQFGTYTDNRESSSGTTYGVMIGTDGVLYLIDMKDDSKTIRYTITEAEHNELSIAKKDPNCFAETIAFMVERILKQ